VDVLVTPPPPPTYALIAFDGMGGSAWRASSVTRSVADIAQIRMAVALSRLTSRYKTRVAWTRPLSTRALIATREVSLSTGDAAMLELAEAVAEMSRLRGAAIGTLTLPALASTGTFPCNPSFAPIPAPSASASASTTDVNMVLPNSGSGSSLHARLRTLVSCAIHLTRLNIGGGGDSGGGGVTVGATGMSSSVVITTPHQQTDYTSSENTNRILNSRSSLSGINTTSATAAVVHVTIALCAVRTWVGGFAREAVIALAT
jgi:hypothetical protein